MFSRVYVEITNICNKNCSFCHGTKRKPGRMSLDEFKLIAERLKGVTEYLYLHIMGEPLTHPQLIEMIRCATGMGFKVAITTNGTLLPERGEEMISSGVYKVNISLHSFEDGTAGEYSRYLTGCFDFADESCKNGILTVLRLWNNGCDGGRNEDIINKAKQRLCGEWHTGSRGIRVRDKLHIETADRFSWPDLNAPDNGDSVFCYGLKDHFGILCDGTVVPCCLDGDGVINLGNIFSSTVEEILSSGRAEAMREGFKNRRAAEQFCRRCGYARRFDK